MEEWIGLTVAQVLKLCGSDFSEARILDEPPGKLRAVEFICRAGQPPQRVILEIEYHPELFSSDRSWSQSLVQAQKVVQAHTSTDHLF